MTLNEMAPVIKRASKAVAYQWPGVVEKDDVEMRFGVEQGAKGAIHLKCELLAHLLVVDDLGIDML